MNIIKNLGEKVIDAKDNTKLTFHKISSIFTQNDYPYMKLELKLKLNQIFRKDPNDYVDPKDKDFIFAILKNFYDIDGKKGFCKICKYEIIIYDKLYDNGFFNSGIEEHSIECLLTQNHHIISMYKIYQKYY